MYCGQKIFFFSIHTKILQCEKANLSVIPIRLGQNRTQHFAFHKVGFRFNLKLWSFCLLQVSKVYLFIITRFRKFATIQMQVCRTACTSSKSFCEIRHECKICILIIITCIFIYNECHWKSLEHYLQKDFEFSSSSPVLIFHFIKCLCWAT